MAQTEARFHEADRDRPYTSGMQRATTVRVTRETRDGLRVLAEGDGVTLDEEVNRLVRAERQRRIGHALAAVELDRDDESWLTVGASVIRNDAAG